MRSQVPPKMPRRREYTNNPGYWRSGNPETTSSQEALEAENKSGFQYTARYVEDIFNQGHQVETHCVLGQKLVLTKMDV